MQCYGGMITRLRNYEPVRLFTLKEEKHFLGAASGNKRIVMLVKYLGCGFFLSSAYVNNIKVEITYYPKYDLN